MMAPGPLDALPALLDIVANDERAAELSAAPLVLVDRVWVSARFEKLDNALARTSNTCPVKYRLRARKKANNFACQAMVAEQYPQIGHVSLLYGLFQFNQHLTFRGALRHHRPLLMNDFARAKIAKRRGKNPF